MLIRGMQVKNNQSECDVIMHTDKKSPQFNTPSSPCNISKSFLLLFFLEYPTSPLLLTTPSSSSGTARKSTKVPEPTKMVRRNSSDLPPGFRFHPTDEELIMYYLRNQATSRPCPVSIIPEVDIYKFDPWELPEKTEFGENEWYFFTPRDRKYPNGVRPNRAAVSGYWKATGTDKSIYSGSKYVGVKKALVFYKGRPPKGTKTDWIMHEYRLSESRSQPSKQNGSMRLDDWVLCRIYKKKNLGKTLDNKAEAQTAETVVTNDQHASHEPQTFKFPRPCSLSHLWELDCMGSISQLFGENSHNTIFDLQNMMHNNGNVPRQLGDVGNQYSDAMKFQGNQPVYVNPVFEFQ